MTGLRPVHAYSGMVASGHRKNKSDSVQSRTLFTLFSTTCKIHVIVLSIGGFPLSMLRIRMLLLGFLCPPIFTPFLEWRVFTRRDIFTPMVMGAPLGLLDFTHFYRLFNGARPKLMGLLEIRGIGVWGLLFRSLIPDYPVLIKIKRS